MSCKKLITITSKKGEGNFSINFDLLGSPCLEVYSDGKYTPIDNYGDLNRVSSFEDLYTSLYEREWGIGGRLYSKRVGGIEKLYYTLSKYDSQIPVIKSTDKMFLLSEDTEDSKNREEFENLYTKLMKIKSMNDIKEIDLGTDYYRYLVSSRNLIDQSTTIDLFSYSENSTDYGNILNLNELLQKRGETNRYEGGGYTIRLVVMYVNSGFRMSGTLMFDPFRIDDNGNLGFNTFQATINDDVTIEVKNGCIRLFPERQEITECIIYHCYLVYEKLL